MLCALMDGHARSSTELAVVGRVAASTASSHLKRLEAQGLVTLCARGRHRYYRLKSQSVARTLERLMALTGQRPRGISTPSHLRSARSCYDHMAGALGVALHDRLLSVGWIDRVRGEEYRCTSAGRAALEGLGIDVMALRGRRRRFAYGCLDWSERRPHLGGALGSALFELACHRKWVTQDIDSRRIIVTALGRRELRARCGLAL